MKLKTWLKINNIHNQDFAKTVDVSHIAVSHWVTGKKKPSIGSLAKIQRATGGLVCLEDFLPTSHIDEAVYVLNENNSRKE